MSSPLTGQVLRYQLPVFFRWLAGRGKAWDVATTQDFMLADQAMMRRAHAELAPAAAELAGAGSGMLTAGPVEHHLAALSRG